MLHTFLSFWMPAVFKKHSLICKSFFPRPTQFWDHMQESSQWNCGEDYFITLHVGGRRNPLFSRPTSLWARAPAVSTLKKHTSLWGYIFFPFPHRLLWPFCVSLPLLQTLLFLLLLSPSLHQWAGWAWSCQLHVRKRAAATIITLIAHFFCWAEINRRATIQLLKTPQKSPSKDGRVRVKEKGGKKIH